MKIIHTGLREETLANIKNEESIKHADYFCLDERELLDYGYHVEDADILLLGENTENPIKLAQKINSQANYLSILLINDPPVYQKLKQSLLFTPFVGPFIVNIPNSTGKGLADIVKGHVSRSQQRKSYKMFKTSVENIKVPSGNKFEKVKKDFIHIALLEAPVGIILTNRSGFILSFNHNASTLFNKTEKDALGSLLVDLFPEEVREELSIFYNENHVGRPKKVLQVMVDGAEKYLELSFSNLNKEENNYKVAIIHDVTVQVQAQKSVEESAKKVSMILESMPDIAWAANPAGEITYFNKVWHDFTKQRKEEALGMGWQNAVHKNDLKLLNYFWKNCIAKGFSFCQYECRIKCCEDGQYKWHLVRASPIMNNEGKVEQWIGTFTDVQAIKQVEEELQETTKMLAASNEELSAANEEIMANNDELHSTNEKLERVNADLDNFIYTASHDLKAPITNIEGLTHLLSQEVKPFLSENKSIEGILRMIDASVLRFKRTILDLTEISKIQRLAGLELEPLSIKEIANEVLLDLEPQIQESQATIKLEIDNKTKIKFSRKNLKSIVYNLLSNALKYRSPERNPEVLVSFYKEGAFKVLCVRDNGLGFDVKDESKIFSMFKRLHSHVEGSGIGLYMVKKIIENAKGHVAIDSKVGVGSTFKIYFPRSH